MSHDSKTSACKFFGKKKKRARLFPQIGQSSDGPPNAMKNTQCKGLGSWQEQPCYHTTDLLYNDNTTVTLQLQK